jgi:hypothetical protein
VKRWSYFVYFFFLPPQSYFLAMALRDSVDNLIDTGAPKDEIDDYIFPSRLVL